MMRKNIVRSLTETTINAYTVKMVDSKPVVEDLEPLVVYGTVTENEALKELKRVYGANDFIAVKSIDSVEKKYKIPVEKFVENATVVDTDEEENEETK